MTPSPPALRRGDLSRGERRRPIPAHLCLTPSSLDLRHSARAATAAVEAGKRGDHLAIHLEASLAALHQSHLLLLVRVCDPAEDDAKHTRLLPLYVSVDGNLDTHPKLVEVGNP